MKPRTLIPSILVALIIPATASAHTRSALTTTTTYIPKPTAAGVVTGGMGDASWKNPLTALNEGIQQYEFAQPESYLPMMATKKLAVLDFTNPHIPAGATIQSVRLTFRLFTYPPETLFQSWMRVDLGYEGTPNSGPCWWIEESPYRNSTQSCTFPWHPSVAELDSGSEAAFFMAQNLNGPGFASIGVNAFELEVEAH